MSKRDITGHMPERKTKPTPKFNVGDVVKVIAPDSDQHPAMIQVGGGGVIDAVYGPYLVRIAGFVYETANLEFVAPGGMPTDIVCQPPSPPKAAAAPKERKAMTKAEYISFHSECCERMKRITAAKNSDYTGKTDDPFRNFSDSETYAGVTTERGFLVRMGDKMARVRSFMDKGTLEVKDEAIEDTLLDLANYAILLTAYLKGKR